MVFVRNEGRLAGVALFWTPKSHHKLSQAFKEKGRRKKEGSCADCQDTSTRVVGTSKPAEHHKPAVGTRVAYVPSISIRRQKEEGTG